MGLVSGTAYAFGGYERDLKFAIALSQTEVQALGIVIDVAMGGTQMLSGWIVDNFSSCVGAGVASLLVGAGYMTVALALWGTGDADAGAEAGAGAGALPPDRPCGLGGVESCCGGVSTGACAAATHGSSGFSEGGSADATKRRPRRRGREEATPRKAQETETERKPTRASFGKRHVLRLQDGAHNS